MTELLCHGGHAPFSTSTPRPMPVTTIGHLCTPVFTRDLTESKDSRRRNSDIKHGCRSPIKSRRSKRREALPSPTQRVLGSVPLCLMAVSFHAAYNDVAEPRHCRHGQGHSNAPMTSAHLFSDVLVAMTHLKRLALGSDKPRKSHRTRAFRTHGRSYSP